MIDSFIDIMLGFLAGSLLMGLFAFWIVPKIEKRQKENAEIKRIANEHFNKYYR